jgi:hypothetical protein
VPNGVETWLDFNTGVISASCCCRETRVIVADSMARLLEQIVANHPGVDLGLPELINRLPVRSEVT